MKYWLKNFYPKGDEIIYFALSFIVIFVTAKFGQYLFYEWSTSPAVLWPPAGIALAILWLGGYRYAVPIFIALVIASYNSPGDLLFPIYVITPFSQMVTAVVGIYLLRRQKFDENFGTLRDMVTFLSVITISSLIAPTINVYAMLLAGDPLSQVYFMWLRSWAGYLFSSLILFPFIITWAKHQLTFNFRNYSRFIETSVMGLSLFLSVYIIFWLHLDSEIMFLFFATFFITFFWVCLRFSPRVLHLCMFFTVVLGLLGLFMSPDSNDSLNVRLLGTELFFLLLLPIFHLFSALVQESNQSLRDLAENKNKFEKESVNKSEFIAILAHELRNPLAPLKTTLEILELENLPPDIKSLINSAQLQVLTMRRLLDDLLDTTRMAQGKFQLQIVRANLCSMLEHCIEYTKSFYKERNHSIDMDKVCNDKIWLDVDPMRFEQIIVNILNNAAKYTDYGGKVSIKYVIDDGNVHITISDNGVGIHPDNIGHIFDSFWQVDRVIPRAGGGIGVGLSLTKQIVEMHGGSIKAKSDGLGKGTSFIVVLPLSKSLANVQPVHTVLKPSPSSMNILVVDDNQAAADSLAKLLKMKGHLANVSYSGLQTISLVDKLEPKIVFLDIGLPDIDGYNVARRLRAIGYGGILVALSGYSQKEDIQKAYQNGFDHYLTKPISIATVEEYLQGLEDPQKYQFKLV